MDQNLFSIGAGNASFNLSGTYGGISFSIPSAVSTNSGLQTGYQSLASLSSFGTSSTPLGNLNLDLDAIAQTVFTYPPMEYKYNLQDYIKTDLTQYGIEANVDLTVIDIDANINASVAQQFTFTPTDITVDLTSSTGDHLSGQLGEQFLFSTPETGNGNVTINATYTIDGVLRNQTGLVLSASLDIKALDLGIKANLAGYGLDWSPFGGPLIQGSLPNGGLLLGSPLYL
ncbi:hypothetical protein [Crenothrix sp.]|uniref:hypothetical protein n=1 Tax=Crenothrix sp. TaxID=3100433 RepID=UPI00374D5D84